MTAPGLRYRIFKGAALAAAGLLLLCAAAPIAGATAYDAGGNVETATDSAGAVTGFEYDLVNRIAKTIDGLLGERSFAYDVQNNLTAVTDARGETTSFAYDLLSRREGRTNPLTETVTFAYDSRDNVTGVTDAKGQAIVKAYDDLNRLTGIATPDNAIAIAYDPASNVLGVTDDDSDLSFTYDGLNRAVTAATGPGGIQPLVTLTNTYDAAGNRISLADDAGLAGAVIGYAFDGAGRLTELTTPAGQTIDLAFDPAGRVTGVTYPNTVASSFAYDLDGRLSQLTHARGLTDLADFGYGYDGLGNLTSIAEIGQARNFTYDLLQRLTAGGTAASPESYTYDEEGNRTASHLSAGHVTDAASRLIEDDDFTYSYDLNGNLASKTAKAGGAVTSYTWDAQDQLVQIDFPDLTTAEYRYDGLGRRIEKDVAGTVTRYLYDGEDILLEFDGAGTLLARTSHGQGTDQPLAVERGGQSFFYHVDHQGSVRKITDAAGLVVNSYDYDSYGNIEASFEGIANPYTYTGRELDAESGLYYYRARYYDPATGKFLGEDPLGFAAGDFNLSRYVFNNPVNLTDPSGEIIPQLIGGCILGSAIDAGLQLIGNGGRLGCLNLGEVAGACVVGSIGAALGPVAGRLVAQQFGRVAKAVRGANGRVGPSVRRFLRDEFGGVGIPSSNVTSATQKLLKINPRVLRQLNDPRLGKLRGKLSAGDVQRLANNPNAARFLDTRTGNINVIQTVRGKLIRITTPKDANQIISVGPIRQNQVLNRINSGDFVPIR